MITTSIPTFPTPRNKYKTRHPTDAKISGGVQVPFFIKSKNEFMVKNGKQKESLLTDRWTPCNRLQQGGGPKWFVNGASLSQVPELLFYAVTGHSSVPKVTKAKKSICGVPYSH